MGYLQLLAGVATAIGSVALGANPLLSPLAFLSGYAATGGYKFLYIVYRTLPRDLWTFRVLYKAKDLLLDMDKKRHGIPEKFLETAKKYPDKIAITMEDEHWTFSQLDEYANQVGHCFSHLGAQHGDTIAVFMENKPEFIGLWIGLSRIGVVPSFINTKLRSDSLLHCITTCKAKTLVFGLEMKDGIEGIKDKLEEEQVELLVLGERGRPAPSADDIIGINATIIDSTLAAQPKTPPREERPSDFNLREKLFYIYTSGTTGLPKPSKINHQRFFFMGYGLGMYNSLDEKTSLYCALPLYHTNAAILATGAMVFFGAKVVITRKFSASRFWDDCIKHDCNTTIYIGEFCRYLLAQPPKAVDTQHKVRLAMGNGLKRVLWEEFVERFKVTKICEFYGATESNCSLGNPYGKVGSVGYTSRIFKKVYPVCLIKVNMETLEPYRQMNGLCIECEPGEPGEIVGKIEDNDPLRRFDGYLDPNATNRKIIHNVHDMNDKYFRSGDILVQDEEGWYYFQDRTGDTYRWKGENVSSQEIEGHMQRLLGMQDVAVYGVEIPGCDGRAGMAAIVGSKDEVDGGLDMADLHSKVNAVVPSYAAPIFLRIIPEAELTGTFKLKKVKLCKEGYNLDEVGDDPIYVKMPSKSTYQRLEKGEIYEKLRRGELRF